MTEPDAPTSSRRTFLRRGGLAAAGLALASAGPASAQDRVTRRVVTPAVAVFEGNYEGQFLLVHDQIEVGSADVPASDPTEVPITECGFEDAWPPEETRVYEGQLVDRLGETPVTVDMPVYADGTKEPITPDSAFVVQNVRECPGDYVGLEVEWITREAVTGKPPGPTVAPDASPASTPAPTDAPIPGFGAVAALVGGAGALAVRTLAARRTDDEP